MLPPTVQTLKMQCTTKAAYDLGRMDAQRGQLCVPEIYYTNIEDHRAYARGYETVAGRTLLSRFHLGANHG
jgi:hypothetical protein